MGWVAARNPTATGMAFTLPSACSGCRVAHREPVYPEPSQTAVQQTNPARSIPRATSQARTGTAPRGRGRPRACQHRAAAPRTRSSSAPAPPVEFRDTDTWRALRILGEFVEGFDALAEVGPAVTIFGSARVGRRNRYYGGRAPRGRRPGAPGLRDHHRRRPGDHGGGQPRRQGRRRPVHRLQHRAALRAGAERVRRPGDGVPLLLRPQDDVREVRGGASSSSPAASARWTSCSRR